MRLHWLYTVVSSTEFKDQNKGDHGNIAQCGRFLFHCSTLIIVRKRSSIRALESVFITQSTRHHETSLHPSHKEVPSVCTNSTQLSPSLPENKELSSQWGDTQCYRTESVRPPKQATPLKKLFLPELVVLTLQSFYDVCQPPRIKYTADGCPVEAGEIRKP